MVQPGKQLVEFRRRVKVLCRYVPFKRHLLKIEKLFYHACPSPFALRKESAPLRWFSRSLFFSS
jgi:hypothetical protein